MIAMLSRFW